MGRRRRKLTSHKAGLPPGTIVPPHGPAPACAGLSRVLYDTGSYEEAPAATVEEALPGPEERRVLWINVDGVHQVEALEALGRRFHLHPLLLEDIAHTGQRPKLEDYGEHLFLECNAVRPAEGSDEVLVEQVSLVLGPTWLLSFNESPQPYVATLRERLRTGKGRAREYGADYLAYTVLDVVVDGYFVVLERIGDRIDGLEEELMAAPAPRTLQAIYGLKREVIHLRKSVWPMRELIGGLQRERELVRESTGVYLRDLYDHTVQIMDAVETHRDVIAGMLEMYLSSVSNRMNEVMKVLTVIATIFIPLTFIAGVYGMNFAFMPELHWRYGYFATLGVMALLGVGMLLAFRRRRWL